MPITIIPDDSSIQDCSSTSYESDYTPMSQSGEMDCYLSSAHQVYPVFQQSCSGNVGVRHVIGTTQCYHLTNLNHGRQTHPYGFHFESKNVVHNALEILRNPCVDILDVLTAMKQVPYDSQVQEMGCERLWILTWEDDNAAAVGRVGGISLILDAMIRFPMNAHLQQCGCESLQNLATNEYNREVICERQGVNVIVKAMMRHYKVAGIQQSGATALTSLAIQKEYHSLIHHAGGVQAIMVAARNFANETCVLRAVMDALHSLGYETPGRSASTEDDLSDDEDYASSMMMTDYEQEPNLVCASSPCQ